MGHMDSPLVVISGWVRMDGELFENQWFSVRQTTKVSMHVSKVVSLGHVNNC